MKVVIQTCRSISNDIVPNPLVIEIDDVSCVTENYLVIRWIYLAKGNRVAKEYKWIPK